MSKFEGLQLLAGLVSPSEDASAILMLCGSTGEHVEAEHPAEIVMHEATEVIEHAQDPDTELAMTNNHNTDLSEKVECNPQPPASNFLPQPPSDHPGSQTVTTVARHRPNTAEKIHMRTARLINELAEIDKFRELRTISNHQQYLGSSNKSSSPKHVTKTLSQSGPANPRTVLPPIHSPNQTRGGLFSETLAQSNKTQAVSATRVPTAGSVGPKSQTRGDGRAGFSCKESKIAGLVQQLSNKWGR